MPYIDLLNAVQADIQTKIALGFITGVTSNNVYVQKLPRLDAGVDQMPSFFVCPARSGERINKWSFQQDLNVIYPVEIYQVWPGNFDTTSNLATVLNNRKVLIDHFSAINDETITGLWNVRMKDDQPTAWEREMVAKGYDINVLHLYFYVMEKWDVSS